MVTGKAPSSLYLEAVRRAPAYLTGGNKLLAESSRLQTSRFASALWRFQSYPVTAARNIARPTGRALRALRAGDMVEAELAVRQVVKQLGFSMLSGAAIQLVMAGLRGGPLGMSIWMNEAAQDLEDEPLAFLGELLLYGVGGPASVIWNATGSPASEQGFLMEAAGRATFPGQMFAEASQALSGSGAYEGKDLPERTLRFLQRNPVGSIAANWAGTLGLGGLGAQDKAAIHAYYRWADKRDKPLVRITGGATEDARFRDAMADAAEIIKAGQDPTEALQRAYGLTGDMSRGKAMEKIERSLSERRLLARVTDPADRADLRERIGEDAYARLEIHDELLEEIAKRVRRYLR
jgi:hypothetical protein